MRSMSSKKRDDFSVRVKDALAKRAQFLCSNPNCRRLTLKPSESASDRYIYVGKSCHITAASEGGPRFDSTLSGRQRSSIENGIYLCPTCAELIDKNQGRDSSVEELRQWKRQHEVWISQQHRIPRTGRLTVISGTH